jgi:hypothetical protein
MNRLYNALLVKVEKKQAEIIVQLIRLVGAGRSDALPYWIEDILSDLESITEPETRKNQALNIADVSHFYSEEDIVSYKNTRGNIREAKITGFNLNEKGKWWFYGIDTKTKAHVFYPEHLSRTLYNCG